MEKVQKIDHRKYYRGIVKRVVQKLSTEYGVESCGGTVSAQIKAGRNSRTMDAYREAISEMDSEREERMQMILSMQEKITGGVE